jgi:hypothetical protein
MPRSKTLTKTKLAGGKSVAKISAKPGRIPPASTRSGRKQEAILALLAAPLGPRLFGRGGAQETRAGALVREARRRARLPHRGEGCRAKEKGQVRTQGCLTAMPSPSFNREAIEAEIGRIRSLAVDALRSLWHATFRTSPPPGFTKDLIARCLCWHIQEQAFGGLDPQTAKHLASLARGGLCGLSRSDHRSLFVRLRRPSGRRRQRCPRP